MKYTLEQTIDIEAKALLCTIQANFLLFILNMLLCIEAFILLYMQSPAWAVAVLFVIVFMIAFLILLQRLSAIKAFGKKGTIVYSYRIAPEQIEMAIGDTFTMKYERSDVEWSKETKTGLFIKHKRMAFIMFYKGEYKDAIRDTLMEYGWIKGRKMSPGRIFGITVHCLLVVLLGMATVWLPAYLASIQ